MMWGGEEAIVGGLQSRRGARVRMSVSPFAWQPGGQLSQSPEQGGFGPRSIDHQLDIRPIPGWLPLNNDGPPGSNSSGCR